MSLFTHAGHYIKKNGWKILCVLLMLYICIMAFLIVVPTLDDRLQESIRNFFFHVPMWFGLMVLLTVSVVNAILYLKTLNPYYDLRSWVYASVGVLYGVLGLISGMIWANYQWGAPWSGDPKQNGAAIALLIYFAYFVLRGSMEDSHKKQRVAAVYNIFAFFMLFPTLWILPRLTQSLHPGGQGTQGNPGINGADLDIRLKIVFWPAVIGWTLLGVWITTLQIRYQLLLQKNYEEAL